MRIHKMLSIALLAMLGALQLTGCASSPSERSTGQVIDDSALTTRVKSALAVDAGVATAANIDVTTYRGVVQLSGFVDSQAAADRAVAIAKGVSGVQSVQNDLRLSPPRQ